MKTPNCDKLTEHITEYNIIMEFLDFHSSKGINLYKIRKTRRKRFQHPAPIYDSVNDVETIYRYLGINGKKLDKERKAVLDSLRDEGIKNE